MHHLQVYTSQGLVHGVERRVQDILKQLGPDYITPPLLTNPLTVNASFLVHHLTARSKALTVLVLFLCSLAATDFHFIS